MHLDHQRVIVDQDTGECRPVSRDTIYRGPVCRDASASSSFNPLRTSPMRDSGRNVDTYEFALREYSRIHDPRSAQDTGLAQVDQEQRRIPFRRYDNGNLLALFCWVNGRARLKSNGLPDSFEDDVLETL
jgi:hypothetical protein